MMEFNFLSQENAIVREASFAAGMRSIKPRCSPAIAKPCQG